MKYGKLTVIPQVVLWTQRKRVLCQCDCGSAPFSVTENNLKTGNTTNCGCVRQLKLQRRNTKHGMSQTPEYEVWSRAIQRCHNPNNPKYARYGGRGVVVCEQWRSSFEQFYQDVGTRPSPKHSLDRWPDQNGNYSPGNVRWATQREQMRNVGYNVFLTIGGVQRLLIEWAESAGIKYTTLRARLARGMPPEQAIKP